MRGRREGPFDFSGEARGRKRKVPSDSKKKTRGGTDKKKKHPTAQNNRFKQREDGQMPL